MAYPLKDNYKPKEALCQLSFDDLNTICSMINTMSIQMLSASQKPSITRNGKTLRLNIPQGGAGGMDYSDFAFGFSIAGAVVTFQPGEIHHGTRAVITVGTVDKTITADLQYVWIEYTFGGSAVFAGPSTTMPVSTETVMKVWLACFNFADGVATVNLVGHMGNIEIPGAFG